MSIEHSPCRAVELRTASQVRAQLGGISEVTLWRRIRDDDLDFPRPVRISRRLYFKANEIDAWIEAQAVEAAA